MMTTALAAIVAPFQSRQFALESVGTGNTDTFAGAKSFFGNVKRRMDGSEARRLQHLAAVTGTTGTDLTYAARVEGPGNMSAKMHGRVGDTEVHMKAAGAGDDLSGSAMAMVASARVGDKGAFGKAGTFDQLRH